AVTPCVLDGFLNVTFGLSDHELACRPADAERGLGRERHRLAELHRTRLSTVAISGATCELFSRPVSVFRERGRWRRATRRSAAGRRAWRARFPGARALREPCKPARTIARAARALRRG